MLNWIVIWVGPLPLRATAGRSRTRLRPVQPDVERRRRRREAPRLLGRPAAPGPPRSASSSRSALSSSTASSSTARRSATRCAPSGTIPTPRATAASASPATTSSRWRSPACSPASPERSTCSAGSSRLDFSDIQSSTIGFVGIAVALLGRNTALGVGLSGALFAALVRRRPRPATSIRTSSRSRAGRQPQRHHPGARLLFVGADVIVLSRSGRAARQKPVSEEHGRERGCRPPAARLTQLLAWASGAASAGRPRASGGAAADRRSGLPLVPLVIGSLRR